MSPRKGPGIPGSEIRRLRLDLGLTQQELAARIGPTVSPITVSYWENDKRHPSGLYEDAVRRLMAERDRLASPSETDADRPK